ncbi:hypothetical protein AXF42_Ash021423 [Apostasia shenzhenica]|uniref:Uncharacterized protein n=1 Tax=Apostasia shenzhenica TaxID=1088818 RepID=A0A2H9ZS07_9ASPA|nr:hypothetical protein AXF42_Ash021451 [Apostasia shenzhenica]PKA47122.1 hypothetical protein AXF42_Ash021423 [Apostasia shenzhenica]
MKSNLRQMEIGLNSKQKQKNRETCSPSAFPVRIDATCVDSLEDKKTKETCSPSAFPVRIDVTCADSQRKE